MAVQFKVFLRGTNDVRRFRLTEPVSASILKAKICALFAISNSAVIDVKWQDDEGDQVTVFVDADIAEAVEFHQGKAVRLNVEVKTHDAATAEDLVIVDMPVDENVPPTLENQDANELEFPLLESSSVPTSNREIIEGAVTDEDIYATETQNQNSELSPCSTENHHDVNSEITRDNELLCDNEEAPAPKDEGQQDGDDTGATVMEDGGQDDNLAEHCRVSCDVTGMYPIRGVRWHYIGRDYDLCQAAFDRLSEEEKHHYERIDYPRAAPVAYGGKAVHVGVECDASGMHPIIGVRYQKIGFNYDLCEAEFKKLSREEKLGYVRIARPDDVPEPVDFPIRFDSASDPAEQAAALLRLALKALHEGYDIDVRLLPRGADPRGPHHDHPHHHGGQECRRSGSAVHEGKARHDPAHEVREAAADAMHAFMLRQCGEHGEHGRDTAHRHRHRQDRGGAHRHRHHSPHGHHASGPHAGRGHHHGHHHRAGLSSVERGADGLPTGTLRFGSSGPGVEQLQRFLISNGMMGEDAVSTRAGFSGSRTCEAIRRAHRAYNVATLNPTVYNQAIRDALLRGKRGVAPTSSDNGDVPRDAKQNDISATFEVYVETHAAADNAHTAPNLASASDDDDTPVHDNTPAPIVVSAPNEADTPADNNVPERTTAVTPSGVHADGAEREQLRVIDRVPAAAAASANVATATPRVEWEEQIQQLRNMGFTDDLLTVPLLQRHGGSIERVLAEILS